MFMRSLSLRDTNISDWTQPWAASLKWLLRLQDWTINLSSSATSPVALWACDYNSVQRGSSEIIISFHLLADSGHRRPVLSGQRADINFPLQLSCMLPSLPSLTPWSSESWRANRSHHFCQPRRETADEKWYWLLHPRHTATPDKSSPLCHWHWNWNDDCLLLIGWQSRAQPPFFNPCCTSQSSEQTRWKQNICLMFDMILRCNRWASWFEPQACIYDVTAIRTIQVYWSSEGAIHLVHMFSK